MKIANCQRQQNASVRAIMLVECVVYIGMFFLILGIAFRLFYICWDNSKDYRRNADAIMAALNAGERWRVEVRAATGPLRTSETSSGEVLLIPEKSGEIGYRISEGAVLRQNGPNAEWRQVLRKAKSSRMVAEPRGRVSAWRWEVELASNRAISHAHLTFNFEAVPQTIQKP